MSALENLILRLQRGMAKNSSFIKSIRDPYLLIKSLKELNTLIGNSKIKESVALQVGYLIMSKKRNMTDDIMLNTALIGSPGCGKTKISTILAKIWYALGFLKGTAPPVNNLPFKLITDNNDTNQYFNIFLFIVLIWVIGLTWTFYTNYGSLLTFILIITLLVIIAAFWYYNTKSVNNQQKIDYDLKDDDVIRIVSRVDFVDKFVGHTAVKTLKLLEESLGKVLFVDEAYSLLHSPDDTFGMEALTTLNLFLSQHPNEIIVIFAGYQDLLDVPFSAQPGLKRRFMWQFECSPYTSKELFDIFKLKLEHKRLRLADEMGTLKLFDQHYKAFANYGGDVERLIFFSHLEHANDFIENENNTDMDTLSLTHVRKGIQKLKENNTNNFKKDEKNDNCYANFMNMFKSQHGKKEKREKKEKIIEELSTLDCDEIRELVQQY